LRFDFPILDDSAELFVVSKDSFPANFFTNQLAKTSLGKALEAGPLVWRLLLTQSSRPIGAGLAPVLLCLDELTTAVASVARYTRTLKGVDRCADGVSHFHARVIT
jgi:hypothetical protein